MKKNVIWLFLLFTSCSLFENPTTIEVINNNEYYTSTVPYFNGTMYEVSILLYVGDDLAGQESTNPITTGGGSSGIIEIDEDIEKVQVSFKFLPRESEYYNEEFNDRMYTSAYTYIDKGENNIIELNENTLLQGQPKKSSARKSVIQHLNAQDQNK